MQIFLTGTDTNVGKTIIASWLCMHSRYDYWKPIQTGSIISRDTKVIQKFTSATINKYKRNANKNSWFQSQPFSKIN